MNKQWQYRKCLFDVSYYVHKYSLIMNIQGNDFCLKWRFFLLKKKKSMELEYIKLELYLVLKFKEIEFPSRESCLLNK